MSGLDPQKGGVARSEKLTPEERSESAIKAAESRWGNPLPKAKYVDKPLILGNIILDCAVLEDEATRVVSSGQLLEAFGRNPTKGGSDNLPAIFNANNLRRFLTENDKALAAPIHYRVGLKRVVGYNALIIPLICKCYMKAAAAGDLQTSQKVHAKIAEVFYDATAMVGISALVDEASGFQRYRESATLQRLLQEYVSPIMRPWMKTFPDELWPLIHKVYGWSYDPANQQCHPNYGKFINEFIYGEFPKEVVAELRRKAPKDEFGNRPKKMHQGLTVDTGLSQLDQQITRVLCALRSTPRNGGKTEFDYNYAKAMGRA